MRKIITAENEALTLRCCVDDASTKGELDVIATDTGEVMVKLFGLDPRQMQSLAKDGFGMMMDDPGDCSAALAAHFRKCVLPSQMFQSQTTSESGEWILA